MNKIYLQEEFSLDINSRSACFLSTEIALSVFTPTNSMKLIIHKGGDSGIYAKVPEYLLFMHLEGNE